MDIQRLKSSSQITQRLLNVPRRRLIPALCVLASSVVLVYFLWFNAYSAGGDTVVELTQSLAGGGNGNLHESEPHGGTTKTKTPPPGEASASPILLVSAFYPLAKSKHTDEEYAAWLAQFLGHVDTDIYFFTTPALEPIVRAARANITSQCVI